MSKVLFITVRNYTNSTWLDEKLLGLTHSCQKWWADNRYETVIVDSYTDINNYLDQADWLVVQTAGDVIVESNHLWKKLHSIPDDIGFIGHLVWYDDPTPFVHPQCFILRTAAVDRVDMSTSNEYVEFTKSEEDMHQGHAPLEVFSKQSATLMSCGAGASMLADIHKHGYRTVNFDYDWRYGACTVPQDSTILEILKKFSMPSIPSRGYCFPENNTPAFEQALRTLELSDELDTSQQILICLFRKSRDLQNTGVVHILNWDNCPTVNSADNVVCTAGGFLAESIALKTGAKRIVQYDINKNTLDFKKSLYTEWDGNDYYEYAYAWAEAKGLMVEPYVNKAHTKATDDPRIKAVLDNWAYLKTLDIEFVHCDIIKDIDLFVSHVTENSVVHTSTILTYYLVSAISHTSQEIKTARTKIRNAVVKAKGYWSET